MHLASCHCAAVRIEVARRPRSLTRCTCSICRRYAALWAYCTPKTARVLAHEDALVAYLWNDRCIEFYHCRVCGCLTHYEGAQKSVSGRVAVNARMMEPDVLEHARIRTFDGANTWKYLD